MSITQRHNVQELFACVTWRKISFKRSRAYIHWKQPQVVNNIYSNTNSRLKVQCSVASHIVFEVAWSFHNSPRTGSGHSNKVLLHCVLAVRYVWGFLSVKRFLQMCSITGVIRITWWFTWFLEGQLRERLIRSFEMDRVTSVRGAVRCLHFIWPLIKSFHDQPFLPFLSPLNEWFYSRSVSLP